MSERESVLSSQTRVIGNRRSTSIQPVRVGLLGCGLIAQYAHLPALMKADRVKLTAICDIAEDLVAAVNRQYPVPQSFTDLEMFLEKADIDAVLVATADQDHVPNASACLRSGKHVLIEKPLGTNLEECRNLIKVVEETGCKLQVGNMKRYDPGLQFARQFVTTGLGERLSVSGWYCDTTLRQQMQAALRLPVLRSARQQGFDPAFKSNKRVYKLMTHGSHLVNTLRYLGGEIAAVQARLATKYNNFSWHGVLEFVDGAAGHFELTTAVQMDWLEGFRVHGEGGSVEVTSFLPFANRASEVRVFDASRGEYRSPITPDGDAYERQIEAFAQAIQENEPPSPTVYDGFADIAVLLAIQTSVNENRWVEIEQLSRGLPMNAESRGIR